MNTIESLLERYYNAETSPEEEAWLRDYLVLHPEAADEASVLLSGAISALQADAALPAPEAKPLRSRRYLWRLAMPAAAAIVLGLWLYKAPAERPVHTELTARLLIAGPVTGEIQDEALAMEQARKALQYVSATLNKGTRQIGHLEKLESAVDKIKNESL